VISQPPPSNPNRAKARQKAVAKEALQSKVTATMAESNSVIGLSDVSQTFLASHRDVGSSPLVSIDKLKIAVIGLGYVGMPLAAYLGKHFRVVGFDINQERVGELKKGIDRTRELNEQELKLAKKLTYSSAAAELDGCNFFIVTVPTPIDNANRPDLTPLQKASETVGRAIGRGGVVVYESTVYPGATEEICIPIIERVSGLKYKVDFFAGYSPERINPADPNHRLPDIKKITSGSTPESADLIDAVYRHIVTAGTFRASSIRVAEAAKVIENVQRDVNIALFNELALLFKKMDMESREVFEAAGTKWNFHNYQPGLVGGHCIGVDPYYLTHKAQTMGFHPEMILAGRRINDSMASIVAQDVIKSMLQRKLRVDGARILVLGFTFKGNCPDIRNTKVADLVRELEAFGHSVTVHDPLADSAEVLHEYNIKMADKMPSGPFDAVILAVKHDVLSDQPSAFFRNLMVPGGLLYDMKLVLPIEGSDVRL
jgi:UDP-N-acetyl-D-glucosamine/UDP-N-acetyl-D-galactosamine dehydrogenase